MSKGKRKPIPGGYVHFDAVLDRLHKHTHCISLQHLQTEISVLDTFHVRRFSHWVQRHSKKLEAACFDYMKNHLGGYGGLCPIKHAA